MISKEQLDWLRSNLNFSSVKDLLCSTSQHLVVEELVPTLIMAGRTGAGKSSLINAIAGRGRSWKARATHGTLLDQLTRAHSAAGSGLPRSQP